jgi:hypothetical protein
MTLHTTQPARPKTSGRLAHSQIHSCSQALPYRLPGGQLARSNRWIIRPEGSSPEEAADASSSCAAVAARQKPSHVGVRQFRDWLFAAMSAGQALRDSRISAETDMRIGDGTTTRRIDSDQ